MRGSPYRRVSSRNQVLTSENLAVVAKCCDNRRMSADPVQPDRPSRGRGDPPSGGHRVHRRPGDRARLDVAGLLPGGDPGRARGPHRGQRTGRAPGVVRADAADRGRVRRAQPGRSRLRDDVLLGHPRDGAVARLDRRLGHRDDRDPHRRLAGQRGRHLHPAHRRPRRAGREHAGRPGADRRARPADDLDLRARHGAVGAAAERADPRPDRSPCSCSPWSRSSGACPGTARWAA